MFFCCFSALKFMTPQSHHYHHYRTFLYVCAHSIQIFFSEIAQSVIKYRANLEFIPLEKIGRLLSILLPYTFKNACLLLQLALSAAGEGQRRWIWASLFFLPL